MFYTYILRSKIKDRFYIGQTDEINSRVYRHNSGQVLSTKAYRPWELVYIKQFETRCEAMRHEKYLKSLKNKQFLLKIIYQYRGVEQSGSSPGP